MKVYRYKNRIIPIYDISDFPYKEIADRAHVVRSWNKKKIIREVCAFDIETTAYDDAGIEKRAVFQWQFSFNNDYLCFGRSLDELSFFMQKLNSAFAGRRLTICVQNLSYEFMFCAQVLERDICEGEYLFFDPHECVKMDFDALHFVDIAIMHMLSLEKLADDYDLFYRKAAGDFDYDKRFNIADPLTKEEINYCALDVLIPVEWWQLMEQTRGYSTYNMPITKTGFIRQPLRESMKRDYEIMPGVKYREWIRKIQNDYPTFKMLVSQFQGGIVCLAAGYAGATLTGDIRCRDFTSSYPYVMTDPRYYYPINKYQEYGDIDIHNKEDRQIFINLLDSHCCLFRVLFRRIRIKKGVPSAFIASSKCEYVYDAEDFPTVRHNGKVAAAGLLVKIVNEVEFKDIIKRYDFDDIEISEMRVARRGLLPDRIREKIKDLFEKKTQLKGVEGKELELLLSKGDLNGIYGMMAMNVLRPQFAFDMLEMRGAPVTFSSDDLEEMYLKAVRSRNNFLSYAWGCYVTTWARHNLLAAMDLVGFENWIYSDTDSVYYFSTPEIEARFEAWNKELTKGALSARNEKTGKISKLGEMTPDGNYIMFKGFGAKKYLVQKDGGKFRLTVAGVPKFNKARVQDVNDWISGPDDFSPGFNFSGEMTGKLRPEYHSEELTYKDVNGVMTLTGSYINLMPTDYVLSKSVYDDWILTDNLVTK